MKHIKQQIVENVDRVSDKEARTKFKDLEDTDLDNDGDSDDTDQYLHKKLSVVALKTEDEDEDLDEMNVTGNVAGYDTPKAFGKNNRGVEEMERLGFKKVPKTNKYFVPMENKSSYKKMMAEMYGVESINEASNPELDRTVDKFIKSLATKYKYRSSDAVMAVFQALKRLGYIHKSVDYKSPSGFSIEEGVSYHEYKNDESASPRTKVNRSIAEVNKRLMEIEKIINHNIRLKTESGVNSDQYWKRSANTFAKISERLNRINNKLKELGK